jgi:hypothetical protein
MLGRLPPSDVLRGKFAFRQTLFQKLNREATSSRKPVKFRSREIQISRDLLEFGAIDAGELIPAPAPGDNTSKPAG